MIIKLFSNKRCDNNRSDSQQMNILFPRYRGGEYETLSAAVQSLLDHQDTFHLGDIMQYNISYRDYLRQYGIDELVELMLHEAPVLRQYKDAVMEIYERFEKMGKVANYDIQCYDITKPIPVLGKKLPFSSLEGKNVEWFLRECRIGEPNPFPNDHAIQNAFGLHLGQVYENYPQFDSSDWCDDRSYQNYIIRTSPIINTQLVELMKVEALSNRQRVHERIPEQLLPVLYYEGEGRYALLATRKER